MKKKLMAMLGGTALVAGGAVGVAFAAPGPNGSNHHGLCTAYFNGSENGRAHKRNAPPFRELTRVAEEAQPENNDSDPDNDIRGEQAVFNWCSDVANNPKGIGGNPTLPGDDTSTASRGKGRGKG